MQTPPFPNIKPTYNGDAFFKYNTLLFGMIFISHSFCTHALFYLMHALTVKYYKQD